jgi:putative DNA primase/helicase
MSHPDTADAVIHNEPPEAVHHNQVRFAYVLANTYAGKLMYVHSLGWFCWDSKRWVYDETGTARRAVIDILRRSLRLGSPDLCKEVIRCESAQGIDGILRVAASLTPFAATVRDLDADPYLLNAANGTLDLRTLELRPHSPADRITKVTRGAYHLGAKSALWDSFLSRILPDEEVRGFLQRYNGVGLLGEVREHALAIWTGTGANGKSVCDTTIRWALGDYALTAEPDLFMQREGAHPTGVMDLLGARWVTVSESEKDRRLAEAAVKRLTGGDTIRARKMRQDFVEFHPSHTPVLITNHLPKVSGDDAALWRRLRVVPFDVVIPDDEQDRTLPARLELEADAVLSWAVEGWRKYEKSGLAEPKAVRVATDQYHHDSDAVARFIKEECVTGSPVVKATTAQLHFGWEGWRTRDGAEPMSQKAFGLALDRHGFPQGTRTTDGRWRPGIALLARDAEASQ